MASLIACSCLVQESVMAVILSMLASVSGDIPTGVLATSPPDSSSAISTPVCSSGQIQTCSLSNAANHCTLTTGLHKVLFPGVPGTRPLPKIKGAPRNDVIVLWLACLQLASTAGYAVSIHTAGIG